MNFKACNEKIKRWTIEYTLNEDNFESVFLSYINNEFFTFFPFIDFLSGM